MYTKNTLIDIIKVWTLSDITDFFSIFFQIMCMIIRIKFSEYHTHKSNKGILHIVNKFIFPSCHNTYIL